jgi:hypothetical protein
MVFCPFKIPARFFCSSEQRRCLEFFEMVSLCLLLAYASLIALFLSSPSFALAIET